MTRADMARVLEVRAVMWPHAVPAHDPAMELNVWMQMLGGYAPEDVVTVMRSMQAAPHAPTVGQIADALDPEPDCAVVLAEFQSAMAAGKSPLYTDPATIEWAHPAVRAAAMAGLWRRFGEAPDPIYDEYSQANYANWLRHEFNPQARVAIANHARARLALGPAPATPELTA